MRFLLIIPIIVALVGCSSMTVNWTPYPAYEKFEPTEKVSVLNFKPEKPFVELGSLRTDNFVRDTALKQQIGKAKELGADAVIILKDYKTEGFPVVYVIESVLIKYK